MFSSCLFSSKIDPSPPPPRTFPLLFTPYYPFPLSFLSPSNHPRILRADPPLPLRKEIETITVYTYINDDQFTAQQRTATFLSNRDPRYFTAYQKDPRVENTAIDVRSYTLNYQRIR